MQSNPVDHREQVFELFDLAIDDAGGGVIAKTLTGKGGHILLAFFIADLRPAPWAKATATGIGRGGGNVWVGATHFLIGGVIGLGPKFGQCGIDLITGNAAR